MASGSESKSPILAIMELANMISVPMSLNAVVRLNVPEVIWQGGSNAPLSAAEILSAVAAPPPANPCNLQRILRLLASHGVFHQHCSQNSSEIRYSLTEVGKTLVTGANGASYGHYVLQHHQDALLRAWPLLHEAVVDPSSAPFVKANGEPAYHYYGKQPEMNSLMQTAMSGVSASFMEALLDGYDGFQGVETLVDAGGSSGECLGMIMTRHPTIKRGVNFDLPEVVGKASKNAVAGLTHVGGNMLESIPSGDAIFIKWVLSTCTDEQCYRILKNCYNAIPPGGKVIACEVLAPDSMDNSCRNRALLEGDIFVWTTYNGRHRTEMEYQELASSIGFSNFAAKLFMDHFFTVLEFHK